MEKRIKQLICVFLLCIFAIFAYGCSSDESDSATDVPTQPGEVREPAVGTSGNPIITSIFTADPSAHVWPSDPYRLFLYPSQDIFPAVGCDRMDRYHVFSTINMVDWVNHGEILRRADLDQDVWGEMYPESYFMWAPDAAYCENHPDGKGPYFFFFPVSVGQAGSGGANNWNYNWKIGVAWSDRPYAGFRDNPVTILTYPDGRPIHGSGQYIDPSIFSDRETGNHYLVVGGSGVMRVARLSADLFSLAEDFVIYNGLPYFHEGPWMFSRVNDYGVKLYYVMYAASIRPGGGSLAYVTSEYGPYGPWTFGSEILGAVTTDTNHGSIVEFLGQWYLFFHTDVLSMGQNNLRSSSVERIHFNPDGSILPVVPTQTGVPAVGQVECADYLNQRFGVGNWSIEIPFNEFAAGLSANFDGFVLHRTYDVMDDTVNVYLAERQENTRAVHNLHIAGSYVEFTGVYGGTGGTVLLEVNYGTQSGGLAQVVVNGVQQYVLRTPATGGWEDFTGTAFVQVELNAGDNNTIRVGGLAMNIRSIAIHLPE
ncbi:MAG: family 43 glycosylhydrolase [Defluviitaleaceae bacterium]|nr:family 43 glycosylhydrolase [Defluviitaleaceae bacterium]